MIRINLLPRKLKGRAALLRQRLTTFFLVALVAVGIAYLIDASLSREINRQITDVRAKEKEISALKARLNWLEEYKKTKSQYTRKLAVIEQILKGRTGPIRVLDTLATSVPSQMWLEGIKQVNMRMKITGWAADNLIVSRFMSSLQSSPLFTRVELESVSRDEFRVAGQGSRSKAYQLNKFAILATVSYSVRR
ncbi:MAG: PilN domain-containing protein [Thermodesulfobacteriota bacterium]